MVSFMKLSQKQMKLLAGGLCLLVVVLVALYFFKRTESFQDIDGEDGSDGNLIGLADNEVGLVKVSATWCGHCKSMQSDWDKLYAEYNNKNVNGKTAKIITIDENNDKQDAVMSKYDIGGYPTIFKCHAKNGEITEKEDHTGARTYDGLKSFLLA